MNMDYQVKLDKFSGPLEKLLELIQGKQLEITLVSLAQVTGDFLDYLKTLDEESRHPSVLADFVVVASRLLLIKSKAILPSLEFTEEEEMEIKDLEARLMVYKEFKAAALGINQLWNKKQSAYGRELFANLPSVFYPSENLDIIAIERHLIDIIQRLKALVPEKQLVKKVVMTIEHKVRELLERLKGQDSDSFHDLSKNKPKLEIIVLFLAILHLLRDKIIKTEQLGQFSDIIIKSENHGV